MVVGGGAAGVYGAIRAKTLAPNLNVVVIEKGRPLSKVLHYPSFSCYRFFVIYIYILYFTLEQVKISGGGRCNVTNGHCTDAKVRGFHRLVLNLSWIDNQEHGMHIICLIIILHLEFGRALP